MNICGEQTKKKVEFISGHIYTTGGIHQPCIYCKHHDTFVGLKTGDSWTKVCYYDWTDVTDQYCLQKVK